MRIDGIQSNEVQYMPQRSTTGENRPKELTKDTKVQNAELYGQKKYDEEEVKVAIGNVNKVISGYDRRLQFSVHEATNWITVKVIDTNTDEVIREIPPEKILDMVARLWEMAGIIVDKKI